MNSKLNKGLPDFSNTEIAFAHKSDKALRKTAILFSFMKSPWLVRLSSRLGLWAIKIKLPFTQTIIKNTMFDQFCGGTSVEECLSTIDRLAERKVLTILDYGAEAKEKEEDFESTKEELIRAIEFAADNPNIPVVSLKITGLVKFDILQKVQAKKKLTDSEETSYKNLLMRLESIGQTAENNSVGLFVDAEESWIQDAIDILVESMMKIHNKNKAIVFNTFQMYRHDRLDFLKASHGHAKEQGYLLGAKIVRGAYMEKERARAIEKNYPSPIQNDKASTDKAYNLAIEYCIDNHLEIFSYNATHNLESNLLQTKIMSEKNIDINHPHLNFCQLYGMSDQITYNLGASNFNTMKYVPYGPVKDVVPYLIRRAEENSSVSGEMGREYELLIKETRRRAKSAQS